MLQYFKNKKGRQEYLRTMLGAFASENKDLLIIVGDPESDFMFVGYKDKMVLGKIKSLDGKEMHIIKDVLKRSAVKSQFDLALELFLSGMSDLLKLGMKEANQFYSFISNVLFHFQEKSPEWLVKQGRRKEVLENEVREDCAEISKQSEKVI